MIKLRCVNVKKEGGVLSISLTALSSCLKIREWFYDARHLRKSIGEEKVSFKASEEYKKVYHAAEKNQVAVAKKIYPAKQAISVRELASHMQNGKQSVGKTFLVNAQIFGVVDSRPENVIKIVETSSNKIHPFGKPPKNDAFRYIINLVMTLRDLDKKHADQHVDVYLTAGEEEAHAFDNWNVVPKLSDKKGWKTVSAASLKAFQKNIERLSNPKSTVQMAVQIFQTHSG